MAHLRCTDVQDRPTAFLDLTRLTRNAFPQVVPPCEAAFQTPMAAWRLESTPRTARQFAIYKHWPLPTPDDRLFFILTSLKTYALQGVQGRLFGMQQRTAHQWMHVLLPTLLAALRALGAAPAALSRPWRRGCGRHKSRSKYARAQDTVCLTTVHRKSLASRRPLPQKGSLCDSAF